MHVLYIELSMRLLFREVAHARPRMGALQYGIRALQYERECYNTPVAATYKSLPPNPHGEKLFLHLTVQDANLLLPQDLK